MGHHVVDDVEATFKYKQLIQYSMKTPFRRCANGPYYKEYYIPGYLYWPCIQYRSCDGMICQGFKSRCIPTQSRLRGQTVCVYKCDEKGGCSFNGTRFITYTEHLHCQCQCAVYGYCLYGYEWDPMRCKCIRKSPCSPTFYFDYVLRRCVPHTDYIDGSGEEDLIYH